MFDLLRPLVLSLISYTLLRHEETNSSIRVFQQLEGTLANTKSVAIVGAGSAGLAMLKALLDLPEELGGDWEIILYEQRRDIGGIWLPDPRPVHPPFLPETPLYPLLHTNIPTPTMTFPGFPYPPGTALYSSHEYIERYHQDYASHQNLMPYIMLNHTVLSSSWVGTQEEGSWEVTVEDHSGNKIQRSFDHLVVANGHNHEPHTPTYPGQDDWLSHHSASGREREVLHSIFYRDPQRYVNQTVVVVGSGPSGRDAASQVVLYAHKVYHSVRSLSDPATGPVELKPEISYFTSDAVVFADGSRVHDVDSVILGTGYDLRIPFLENNGQVLVKSKASKRDDRVLTTNLRYLFPLHEHIFSLSSSYPTNALAFIGLPILVASCPSDFAQSIYAAHIIANGSLLDSREELLKELDASEDDLRMRGYDPYYIGHRMVDGSTFDYQDGLINRLKERGAIPDDGTNFVAEWRREAGTYQYLRRGWKRVEELGEQRTWLRGVETEAEWADLMRRLNQWQKEWETRHGLVFPEETTMF
ncbi:FAD/NAD(P)-binding domain-containing protein [Paxillus ammoniavirescens]|nr:FAD/NAD(P)-binding domain-containing protein [Paxillus ammoniavirescens]